MPNNQTSVKRQIAETLSRGTRSVEQHIADTLRACGAFEGDLTSRDLEPILKNVVFTLVDEQRFAGIDVPITHNVSQMQVEIVAQQANVFCEVHVHAPIVAFLQFTYTLENHPKVSGKLRLKGGDVVVKENTRSLDFAAKAALRILNVRAIARRELSEPNEIIRRTLPVQLERAGIKAKLDRIELTFNGSGSLHVLLTLDD